MRQVRAFRLATARWGDVVLAAAFLAVYLPTIGQAQPPASTDPEPTPPAAAGPATPEEATPTLDEEIVVTARRREESLQDTPVAVSPFTAVTLEARQVEGTQDLERITPSLQFKPAGQLSGNTAASVVPGPWRCSTAPCAAPRSSASVTC